MSINKIDLLGLVNAEMIELDGEPGVFVPFYPNIEYLTSQGRDLALVTIKDGFLPVRKNACTSCGKQIIPRRHRDEALGDEFHNPEIVAWIFEGKRKRKTTKATLITREDINDAIKGD